MGLKWLARMFAFLVPLASSVTWAAEIHGRSSTQFQFFQNDFYDRRQVDLSQYLRLSVTNVDKEGKLSFQGYGRLSQDVNNGEGLNSRLYYLYGEYRDLFNKLDMRVGRQFVNLAAGSAIIDGAQVDLKNVGPVAFSILGGRDVLFGYKGEIGDAGNTAFGLSASLAGFRKTDLELSWFRKWDQGDVARDMLGASFKQYLLNSLKLYGNTRYDLVTESFSEVQGGVKYFPLSNLVLTGEWYESYPTFDTTSIYSVFAVNRYQEALFRVDYAVNDMVSTNFGYNRQYYGEGAVANVYRVGLGVRPVEPLKINLEYDNRQGYSGSMNGIILDIGYDLTKKADIVAGLAYDVYQRDSLTGDEIARRYWLGGKYKLASNMAVSGRIQNDVNIRYTENYSGRLVFDYDF